MSRKEVICFLAVFACTGVYTARIGAAVKPLAAECESCDTAANFLLDLNVTVENKIAISTNSLTLKRDEAEALAESIQSSASVTISQMSIAFSREVSEIRSQAEELGIDEELLNDCVTTNNFALNDLYSTVLAEIDHCVNSTLRQSVRLIDQSLGHLVTVRNYVSYLDLQVQQCRLLPNAEDCGFAMVEQILIEHISLPANIREDTERTTAVVEALESSFDECSADRVNTITTVGNDIIKQLRICVGIDQKM